MRNRIIRYCKAVIALAAIVALTSCVKDNSTEKERTFTESDVEAYLSSEEYSVPVKDGYISIVTYNGDTLCVTTKSGTVAIVPKGAEVAAESSSADFKTKAIEDADKIVVSYKPYDEGWLLNNKETTGFFQSVGFEDSKSGDSDYNDLVIHIKVAAVNNSFRVGIHPIAYGATKTINLGATVYLNDAQVFDGVIVESCKSNLFGSVEGTDGYINTVQYDHHYPGFVVKKTLCSLASNTLKGLDIAWWITTNDSAERIYAVNRTSAPAELLNSAGCPYGIVLTKLGNGYDDGQHSVLVGYNWFFYPKERVNIWNYYQVKDGAFCYRDGVEGPDVNDFLIIKDKKIQQLYTVTNGSGL